MRESERKGRRAGGGGGMYSMCEIDRLMGRGRRREREREELHEGSVLCCCG